MARMRSPNFPGIPLEQAVKLVAEIFKNNRQNVIPRESAAKDLGYSGLTGRSVKLLGALNQYDLIANSAKGQMKVTQTAFDILHGIEKEDRLEALHKAGNSPTLFQAIYERFPDGIPGDNAVRSFLISKGFTDKGVDSALNSFLETNRYLELSGVSESYGDEGENEQESGSLEDDEPDLDKGSSPTMETALKTPPPKGPKIFSAGPLDFSLSSTGLKVTGKTNSRNQLNDYIQKLQALAALLPEDADDETEN